MMVYPKKPAIGELRRQCRKILRGMDELSVDEAEELMKLQAVKLGLSDDILVELPYALGFAYLGLRLGFKDLDVSHWLSALTILDRHKLRKLIEIYTGILNKNIYHDFPFILAIQAVVEESEGR